MPKPSLADVAGKLGELSNTVYAVLEAVADKTGLDMKSQDARMVALDSIQQDVVAAGFWLNLMHSAAAQTTGREAQEKLLLRFTGSNLGWLRTESAMITYIRISLPLMVHFKIDNLFQRLLSHLNEMPARRGFWNLSNKVLELAGLPTDGEEKNVLTALANIRNSLHNNGMHSGRRDLKMRIGGMDFRFVVGEKVTCAGFHHIAVVIEACAGILQAILLSERFRGIREKIQDPFASSNE